MILTSAVHGIVLFHLAVALTGVHGFVPTPSSRWASVATLSSTSFSSGDGLEGVSHDDDNKLIQPAVTKRRGFLRTMAQTATAVTGMAAGLPFIPSAASASATSPYLIPSPAMTKDVSWPLGKVAFSLLPLAGTSTRRATVEECIVPDTIWTHDQIQGIVNVNVPVRQTVVRLRDGGLWVHNPVAPTPQLVRQRITPQGRRSRLFPFLTLSLFFLSLLTT